MIDPNSVIALVVVVALAVLLFLANRMLKGQVTEIKTTLTAPAKQAAANASVAALTATETKESIAELNETLRANISSTELLISSQSKVQAYLMEANTRVANENLALRTDVSDLQGRLITYSGKLSELTVELETRTAASQQNADQLGRLNEKVAAMDDALSGTKVALERTQQELDAAKRDAEAMRQSLAETKDQLATALSELDKIIQERETERTDSATERKRLVDQYNAEHELVLQLQDKVKEQEKKIGGQEKEIERLSGEVDTLRQQLETSEARALKPIKPKKEGGL